MKPMPNDLYIPFRQLDLDPDTMRSKQAATVVRVALEAGREAELKSAVGGNLQQAPRPQDPCMSPYGTAPEDAERRARREIDRLRRRADDMEQRLDTYGPSAFTIRMEPVKTGPAFFQDPERSICRVLGRNPTHLRVNGVLLRPTDSGSQWERVEEEAV